MSLAIDNKDEDAEIKALVDSSAEFIEINYGKVGENYALH